MKVADVRCGLYDPLAFQLQDYAQDPVSSRMLRSHIEQQLGFAADRLARFADSIGLQEEWSLLIEGDLAFSKSLGWFIQPGQERKSGSPALAFDRKVLPQRITLIIVFRHQDPPEI